jgi:hypothetical protein
MSYVRRTQTLLDQVTAKINRMRDTEASRLGDEEPAIGTPLHDDLCTAIDAAMWEEAADIRSKVPKSWRREHDSMECEVWAEEGGFHKSLRVSRKDGEQFDLPPGQQYYYAVKVSVGIAPDSVKQWLKDCEFNADSRRLITDKYASIANKIIAYLNTHSSLNTALKEMPELEFYIPQEYLDRVAEKQTKVRKEKESTVEKLDIDVNELTSLAVAHRIATAGN